MKKILFVSLMLLLPVSLFAGSITINWDKLSDEDVIYYDIYRGAESGVYSSPLTVTSANVCGESVCSHVIGGLEEGVTYYFALKGVNNGGHSSPNFSSEAVITVGATESIGGVSVSQIFIDLEDGEYDLTVSNGMHSVVASSGCSECEICEECPTDSLDGLSSGRYEVVVYADGSYTLQALGNSAPVVSVTASYTQIVEYDTVVATATVSDPEGDSLTYSWYVDGTFEGSDTSVTLGNLSVGSHSVYCQVSDGSNIVDSSSINITVLDGPNMVVPSTLTLSADYGDSEVTGSIAVSNSGNGDMSWSAITTSGILSLSGDSGINSGTITVVADLSGLDPGEYYGDVIVSSDDADNAPQTVQVQITITDESPMSLNLYNGNYLLVADGDQDGLNVGGDFTIESWVKFNSYSGLIALPNKWGVPGDLSYYWYIYAPGNEFGLNISADGASSSNVSVSYPFSENIWYHLAVVYTASNGSAKFFVNGVQAGSTKSGLYTSVHNNSAPFVIGANYNGGSAVSFLDGLIDDVRIWKTTRAASQIGAEVQGNELDLVSRWNLNDNVNDSIGGNTLTGGAVYSTDIP